MSMCKVPLAADMLSWLSDSLAEPEALPCSKDMAAVNATATGVQELGSTGSVGGLRLPLMQPCGAGGGGSAAVFMYSMAAADGGVTLQLRESCDTDDATALQDAARSGALTTLSISYQDASDILSDGSIDVLLGTSTLHTSGGGDGDTSGGVSTTFDLFDSSSGHDLTLSPQTFTSSAEAFINDSSDSLGVPPDTDNVSTNEDTKKTTTSTAPTSITNEATKLTVKRARPKAVSPNRQGPQQCQVCSKVFGNASALAKHKLTHSDERKYVCSMCGKAFKRQDHLNGHMLTHRNKKPYECKAEGCGKSYCDARSLRRHTENHHSGGIPAPASLSPAQGAAAGDAASPHAAAATCIQYAPPPTSTKNGAVASAAATSTTSTVSAKGQQQQNQTAGGNGSSSAGTNGTAPKSQLQQLLASEPLNATKNGNGNDGLTKQQLDLIHQIMEQTQRQSQQQVNTTTSKAATPKTNSHPKPKLARTWSAPAPSTTSKTQSSQQSKATGNVNNANGTAAGNAANVVPPKPVECNLCHRKFKNIPALNGHMRLHGGYFKKDAENKKCEKKESVGPPLQTASVSVRALIEEKIINKRITNPQNTTAAPTIVSNSSTSTTPTDASNRTTNAPPLFPLTATTVTEGTTTTTKVTSFVVPAPPSQNNTVVDKTRRHSDAEKFTVPRIPTSSVSSTTAQQEAEALADLIMKRGAKVQVKRATSDPGQSPQQLQIQFQPAGDSFSLSGVTYQSDDSSGYFSPNLQDDVFHQVQDTMLLQGVDAAQLAETIQLQAASLLQDQTTDEQLQDIASLEDYATVTASLQETGQVENSGYSGNRTVSHDLQAVLDSPLPESLAEFSTYHSTNTLSSIPSPKDVLGTYTSTRSPMQFTGSPHTSLATQSPLQSPLIKHDSPGFAYPTPPASHEGQSPGFGNTSLLPLLSPQNSDNFTQPMNSHGNRDPEEPPQASSPLSAAFYTSTMSSAAAVEEALEEVLPGETIAPDDMYPSLTNSPPPQSPISVGMTPVQSPLSNLPNSTSSVTSPRHSGQVTFPLSPHYTLQSQMMPNSDDPLLSSSPKDFVMRKQFEFGGFQSFKIVSGNGLVDFGSQGLTGILVDSNGELKFIQTSGAFPTTKNVVLAANSNLNSLTSPLQQVTMLQQIQQQAIKKEVPEQTNNKMITNNHSYVNNHHPRVQKLSRTTQYTVPGKPNVIPRPKLHIAVDNIKQEEQDDVFLSPTTIPASPVRFSRKRPRSEPLLAVPIVHQSRLRASRGRPPGAAPYTPPPILNPQRTGPGLYAHAKWKPNGQFSCTTKNMNSIDRSCANGYSDSIPESDSTPHINVGTQYQCTIPPCINQAYKDDREPTYEHLLWDPGIVNNCTDSEIETYLEFACCAAIPGGGRNKEYALHLLHLCGGNIHDAMLRLMQQSPSLPPDHPLLAYQYNESDRWSSLETDAFNRALLKHNKDFYNVAKEVGSKTVKQCVQFYYMWKKICAEEHRRIRVVRTHRDTNHVGSEHDEKMWTENKLLGVIDTEPPFANQEHRTFSCEYTDCSASI